MELGLMTEPQLGMTYRELADAARFAERIGLAVFARSDHFDFPGFDAPHATEAFAMLAGLAAETERIELCVLVSPITFRHPGLIAKAAATIDEMSGGRLLLGVGTGWMAEEHLITLEEITSMFPGFELERAEVKVAAHSHGSVSKELPIVILVAHHPGHWEPST